MTPRARYLPALGLGLVVSLGCPSGDSNGPGPVAVDRVTVSASTSLLASGSTLQLTATVYDAGGTVLTDRTVTWSSSSPTVASVDNSGRVAAQMIRGGVSEQTTITATAGGRSGVLQLTVSPVSVAVIAMGPSSPTVQVGQSLTLTATLRDAVGELVTGRLVTWSSLAPSVATVTGQGVVTAVAQGVAEILAVAEGVTGRVVVTVPSVPTVTLTVTSPVAYTLAGDTVTVSWTSTGSTACQASGAWSGARATTGATPVTLATTGMQTFRLRCTGPGGETTAETAIVARRPVLPTSYANTKANGVYPTWLPRFNDATAYADFAGTGELALFTAPMRYDPGRPIEEAGPGLFEFWRLAPDASSWHPLAVPVVQEAPNCMHPRKTVVTDVNGDRRPDLYVLCHGYDALPFPGETSVVLVSQPGGGYRQRRLSPRIGFYHGAATCDLAGDDRPELITADGLGIRLWTLAPDGTGVVDATHQLSQINGHYYTVECLDADLDGTLDVIIGGHEPTAAGWPGQIRTEVIFAAGTGAPLRRTVPTVAGYETVLDFTVTGSGTARVLWVLRTSFAPGYIDSFLQRVELATFASSTAKQGPTWFPWLIPYARGGVHYLGTNALGRGWEMPYVP